MTVRQLSVPIVLLVTAATLTPRTGAQQRQRIIYAALPGVGGGNNLKYGGAGILDFDIDHDH